MFDNVAERDIVASSGILQGRGFHMLLVTWSNHYGGEVVDWQTEVTVDITGFPLLERHCNILACGFHKAKGICRVDGYALSTQSVPTSGDLAIQFPTEHGVRNVMFPATMKTYPYNEAPDLGPDDCSSLLPASPPASDDTARDLGYDRDVLQALYAEQFEDEDARNGVGQADNDDSRSYDSEGVHWVQSPAFSIESDRSWHLS